MVRDEPSETIAFVFTDLVDSTPLWEEFATAMRDALARHDAILRAAVEGEGGHVVKTTGDGLLATFSTARGAAAAACAAQRRLASETWGDTGPLQVRMGIHVGEAEQRDDDYFGAAPNRASRLMAAAHGGQIVLSQAAADFVRAALPPGATLVDLGEHRLRGLKMPEHVYQLTIAGLQTEFPPLQSLETFPSQLEATPPSFASRDEAFAGRERELELLDAAWARARDGVRQVALLAAEPGMGKTRLAGELAWRAFDGGGAVLYGRCDEEAVVPFQPFVEALRRYLAACTPTVLHERLHGLEGDLARVFPELLGRMPGLSQRTPDDVGPTALAGLDDTREAERYRLFAAITLVLTGLAASRPTVLILDDLQWADKPTLLLIRHLIRFAPEAPALLVLSYRDVELSRGHPLADLLADLRREPFVAQLALTGLTETATADLLGKQSGRDLAPSLVAALHGETGGNPLFLKELVRHLVETEAVELTSPRPVDQLDLERLDLPETVRDVIVRRVRRLPASVQEALSIAAVVGPEFDTQLLGRVAERPPGEVLDLLDQACRAGLVYQKPNRTGHYVCAHALMRQAVYSELGTAQRAQLHARVGATMEQLTGSGYRAARMAQHFLQAVPLEVSKAIDYATLAGQEAIQELAFEDAATYFERALQLLEEYEPDDVTQRVELLIERANAVIYTDESAAVHAGWAAVEAARRHGSPEQLGRAAVIFGEPTAFVAAAYPGDHPVDVVDEALTALGSSHPALRARLLALMAWNYPLGEFRGQDGGSLAEEALALARQSGDRLTIAEALFARARNLEGTPEVAERLALGNELVALGRQSLARPWSHGLGVLSLVHLELGDADAFDATIAEQERVGEELRWLPCRAHATTWRATQAMLEGRFDDARTLGREVRRYVGSYRPASSMLAVQRFYLARELGELRNVSALEEAAEMRPAYLEARAMLAFAQLESGDRAAAVASLDIASADDFHGGQRANSWAAVLAMLSEVAASTHRTSQAAALHDFLMPFSGRLLAAPIGLACLGAADRYLAMLEMVLERWDAANEHFERSLELEREIGGSALEPRTWYWQARTLLARGRPRDRELARTELERVSEEASCLGMRRLNAEATELVVARPGG